MLELAFYYSFAAAAYSNVCAVSSVALRTEQMNGAFICDESAFDREDLRALSSCAAAQHYPPAGSSTGTLPLFIVCCFGAARHGNVLAFG